MKSNTRGRRSRSGSRDQSSRPMRRCSSGALAVRRAGHTQTRPPGRAQTGTRGSRPSRSAPLSLGSRCRSRAVSPFGHRSCCSTAGHKAAATAPAVLPSVRATSPRSNSLPRQAAARRPVEGLRGQTAQAPQHEIHDVVADGGLLDGVVLPAPAALLPEPDGALAMQQSARARARRRGCRRSSETSSFAKL